MVYLNKLIYVLYIRYCMILGTVCDAAPKFRNESATKDKFCLSGASALTSLELEHAPRTMAKLKLEHTTSYVSIIAHCVDAVTHILVVPSWLFDWLEA